MTTKKDSSTVCTDFIDDNAIIKTLSNTKEDIIHVRDIIAKSIEKQPLSVSECAALLAVVRG